MMAVMTFLYDCLTFVFLGLFLGWEGKGREQATFPMIRL